MRGCREVPLVFECAGQQLVGVLHRAPAPIARPGVLIVVGGPQYRVGSHRQFTLMARELAASGFPVLRFDYRGMGDSGGDPSSFESIRDDILAALHVFRTEVPELHGVVLWGLCDAASAIMIDGSAVPQIVGQVLVNPWARTPVSEAQAYVRHHYLQRLLQRDFWRKALTGDLDVQRAMSEFLRTLQLAARQGTAGGDGRRGSYIERMLAGLLAFRGPVLLMLSGRDLTAREFEALRNGSREWRRALAAGNVRWVRLEDADHTFSDRRSLQAGTQATLRWLEDAFSGAPT